jgi:hypothetical protein
MTAMPCSSQPVVDLSDRLRRQFSTMPLEGVVRLIQSRYCTFAALPPHERAARSIPGLRYAASTAPSEQLVARLHSGNLDIVLGPSAPGICVARYSEEERLVWVGDVDNLVRQDAPIPLVMLPAPAFIREHIFDILSKAGLH